MNRPGLAALSVSFKGGADMRYDTSVRFFQDIPGEYDARSGNYNAGTRVLSDPITASVTDMTTEEQMRLFGGIRRGACKVRLPSHYDGAFDGLVVHGLTHRVETRRRLRFVDIFYCREVGT